MNPGAWPIKTPRGMIGRIYVEYHLSLLHSKYTSLRPCGFREEDCSMFFPLYAYGR